MAETRERRVQVRKIRAWIKTLPDRYVECRARGYHVGTTFWVDKGERDGVTVWLQHEKCSCGTERTRGVSRTTGRYVGTFSYDHPEGYRAPEGLGWDAVSAEARGLYRLERIERFLDGRATPTFSSSARRS